MAARPLTVIDLTWETADVHERLEIPAEHDLMIVLSGIPSARFEWKLESPQGGWTVEVTERNPVGALEDPVVGAAAVWRFSVPAEAREPDVVLRFVYRRAWERDATPARHAVLELAPASD